MKKFFFVTFSFFQLLTAQVSYPTFNGELRIQLINLPSNYTIQFTAEKVSNTSHWDFNNNLVLTNDYTFQNIIVNNPTNVIYFYWRDGEINGMSKGLYFIKAKDLFGNILSYFLYDLRTSKIYSGSPDLKIIFDYANNNFVLKSQVINNIKISAWDYVEVLCCEQETDKFEPTAPKNLGVFSSGGHPFLYWDNNHLEDYYSNIEVYRSEVYSGPPSSFQLIAILNSNSTTYYDTKYYTGKGAIAYYKVRKVNNSKYSAFSNVASINIIPTKIYNENDYSEQQNASESKFNYVELNPNNIKLYLQNIGNTKNYTGAGSGYWNILNDQVIVYDHGPWIIGKIDNKVYLAMVQWYRNYESSIYSPGPIINNKPAIIEKPVDSLKYRIYKISKNDFTSKDYLEWPKEFGAPTKSDGKPKLYGDQTTWCVYNSLDPSTSYRNEWNIKKDSLPVMPIEIQQLVYSRKGDNISDDDLYSNLVFYEYSIINKGNKPIDSTYFSIWADLDFSGGQNNFPAVDTTLDLAYIWSNKTTEQPAIGFTLLFGPIVSKTGSKAIFKGKEISNKTNLKLSSFHGIIESASNTNEPGKPASSRNEAWNIAKGLYVDGKKMIDPTNNKSTKFMFNGDPITNYGWIYNSSSGGEAGFNLFTGPFNLAPNDTQWVMLVLVPANGKDYKESISKLRNKVKLLKSIQYDSLAFGSKSVIVNIQSENNLLDEFVLEQNYPNPFSARGGSIFGGNPETTIRYVIPISAKESKQIASSQQNGTRNDAVNVTLKVYDILGREVATLVNEFQKPGTYTTEFRVQNSELPSGVYIYKLQVGDFIKTRKMLLLK